MRSNHTTQRSRTVKTRRAVIDALEMRRMLAIVNATEGPDVIRIAKIGIEAAVRVAINGHEQFVVADTITINALGGNDTVTYAFFQPGPSSSEPDITIDLGPGDDTFDHTESENQNARPTILGGTGNDLLLFDRTDGTVPGGITLDSTSLGFRVVVNQLRITYDGFESLEYYGRDSADGDNVFLREKPSLLMVHVNGQGGFDRVELGGGDIDSNGWRLTTLLGGAGTDLILFDDRLDTDAAGEVETYTFDNFSLAKGSPTISYSGFESQRLFAADGGVAPFAPSAINITDISGQMNNTTITGGVNRPNIVNVGSGQIPILDDLAINLGAAGGTINFNDQSAAAARSYQISATEMTSPAPISFTGATAVNLSGGPFNDSFFITGSAAGTSVTVNANGGSDNITLGQGNIDADLADAVTINGGAGTNNLTLNNSLDPAAEVQTLTSTNFTDGLTHGYSSIQNLIVNEGPGGTNLAVNSISVPTTINGGTGDDAISIGTGSLASALGANVVINGGGGIDSMSLLGQNDSGTNTYAFPSSTQFRFGDLSTGKFVNFSGLEQATLRTGSGGDTIDVTTVAMPLSIFAGTGNDAVTVSASTAPVTVDTGPEQSAPFGFRQGDSLIVGTFATPPATVVVEQNDTVINMGVSTGSTLRLAAGAVLNKAWPTVFFIDLGTDLSGTLDVGSGAFLWRSGGSIIPDFRALLTRGRNNGAWNGTGAGGSINSSTAAASGFGDGVGYGLGSQISLTSIGPFSIGVNDTLIRYALDGDGDLSGGVNLNDFNRLAANFGQSNRSWVDGDSTYDGNVNLTDFNPLAANFGTTFGPEALRSNAIRGTRGGDELRELLEELA